MVARIALFSAFELPREFRIASFNRIAGGGRPAFHHGEQRHRV
jgi:hypothetical protein